MEMGFLIKVLTLEARIEGELLAGRDCSPALPGCQADDMRLRAVGTGRLNFCAETSLFVSDYKMFICAG
jgi:hypothetical protein